MENEIIKDKDKKLQANRISEFKMDTLKRGESQISKKNKEGMKELYMRSSRVVDDISTKFMKGKKIDNSNILRSMVNDISKKKDTKELKDQLNKIFEISHKFVVTKNNDNLLNDFKNLLNSEKAKLSTEDIIECEENENRLEANSENSENYSFS